MPAFFVPKVPEEKHEEVYAALAKACGRAALPLEERIYSIRFRSNGEYWTATVGESMRGTVARTRRIKGRRVEQSVTLSNPSIVLAIFPTVPYLVWHDETSRAWVNPFLAGEPSSVRRFGD